MAETTINLRTDDVNDVHVRCSVFMNGAKCGDLCFRHDEYQMFGVALHIGVEQMKGRMVLEPENDMFRRWVTKAVGRGDMTCEGSCGS